MRTIWHEKIAIRKWGAIFGLLILGFGYIVPLMANELPVIPSANFSFEQVKTPKGMTLRFEGVFDPEVSRIAIVFTPTKQLFLKKSETQKGKTVWIGSIPIDDEVRSSPQGQLFIRVGRLRFYSAQFFYKVSDDPEFLPRLAFITHINAKEKLLSILLSEEAESDYEKLFNQTLLKEQITIRNQFFDIRDEAAEAAEKERLRQLEEKKKALWAWILKPDFTEKHSHQVEVEAFSISPSANEQKSLYLYKKGLNVSDSWDWRVQGRSHLFDMHYWNVIKMGGTLLPPVGENNATLEKVYSRFRGDWAFIQFGDLSQRYSSQSLGGNFIGVDIELDLLWDLSFHTMTGFGNRNWNWLYDDLNPTKYRQDINSFRIKKKIGKIGYVAIAQAQGKDDPMSLIATENITPIDTQIIGMDFDFKRLMEKTLALSGEYFQGRVNLDTTSSNVYTDANAYNIKVKYNTPQRDHTLTGFYSQVDPDYRSIGRNINYDRNEWWLKYQTYLLEKKIKLQGRYKTYQDNTKDQLEQTTYNTNPSVQLEYRPFEDIKYFRIDLKGYLKTKKAEATTQSVVDNQSSQIGVGIRNKWGVLDYSVGYDIENQTDNLATVNATEDHNIMKASLRARYDRLGPLSMMAQGHYTDDATQKDSGAEKENVLDLRVESVLDLWGLASLAVKYRNKNRTRTSTGYDRLSSLGIPFTIKLSNIEDRRLELIYQRDQYTYEQYTTVDGDQDYQEMSILLKVVWEL